MKPIATLIDTAIKLLVGWIVYSLAVWASVPEWAVITLVAIGVSGIKFMYTRPVLYW